MKLSIIGLKELDALKLLISNNIEYRVVERNSIPYTLTNDYNSNRYNLSIKDGIIMKVTYG